jgi:hypothetical protein
MKRFRPVLSGICNAARNMGQFAIVPKKLNWRSIVFFVELQMPLRWFFLVGNWEPCLAISRQEAGRQAYF